MPQGEPRSGEKYLHFKNKLYQIVAIAEHSENGEQLVVYQALYGDYKVYARPLSMFISKVDHEKYPEVKQLYRFSLIDNIEEKDHKMQENMEDKHSDIESRLMDFYDASTYEEKYNILLAMKEEITDVMINNMAVVLDVVIPEGDLNKRYEALKQSIRTYQKFETGRFR